MKALLILTALLWSLSAYAQTRPMHLAQSYQEAYCSILASPEFKNFRENRRGIAVFDSIVFEDQSLFTKELSKHWNYRGPKKENHLRDSLAAVDTGTWHKPYYSLFTANLTATSATEKGGVVILFSRQHKDILLAEVSVNREGGATLNDILPMFNQTVRYLLVFGPDGKVQQCHTQLVSYN